MSKRNRNNPQTPAQQPPQRGNDTMLMALLGAVAVALVGLAIWAASRGGATQPAAPVAATPQPPAETAQVPISVPALPPEEDDAALAAAPRITVAEFKERLARGEAVAIDVRDLDSYVAGHIPDALQIPLAYVEGEIPWFPKDKLLVPYCT